NSGIFHFGSLSLTSECCEEATAFALRTARESGCTITYDPNYRPALWESEEAAVEKIMKYIGYADILKVSREEAEMLSGKTVIEDAERFFLDLGVTLVLITDAENGAYFATASGRGHVPSSDVVPVDTTGAGDIFFGSFIHRFISSGKALEDLLIKEISEFASFAAKNAGMSTLKKGGLPSIP
ncbi:MAG: carbohydrate kinase, partial [Clostridia bacterium]|nr:carbohydrate kinase [Clostridia bacterium]